MSKACTDCIHCDVCAKYNKVYERELSHRYCTECKDFKDKSRYIELPCAVGDTVYRIYRWTNEKPIVGGEYRICEHEVYSLENAVNIMPYWGNITFHPKRKRNRY